jgi:uncharacterized membrane protein
VTFLRKLDKLLAEAESHGVLDPSVSRSLRDMADQREKRGGLLSLAGVLGSLGALALGLGVILLIGANWNTISDWTKISGFLAIFLVSHGAGLGIRWKGLPYRGTAEAFHAVGAILFIAGVGLISQIYHINGDPPRAVLLWFIAIAPLAWLLASPGVTVISLFAALLWFHLQGSLSGSFFRMMDSFGAHLLIELGLGVGALGLSARIRLYDRGIGAALAASGALLIFGALYLLGFYRHFGFSNFDELSAGAAWLPFCALALGAAGLAAGWTEFARDAPKLRQRLLAFLIGLLLFGAMLLGVEASVISSGPELEFFDFGWSKTFSTAEWLLSIAAWALWFLIALAAVAFGSTAGRPAYLNLGVLAVGLGIVTRFFDLVGSLAETGLLFVVGGAVLLATAWFTERWRKRLVSSMQGGRS